MGGSYGDYRDREGAYDDYDVDGPYADAEDADDYGGYGGSEDYGAYDEQRPAPMRTYGVDRADYYNDDHAPLVSHSDVRSKPLLTVPPAGQPRDRIPAPRAYRRTLNDLARPEQTDDVLAFKGGLARTPGSLAQLQSERLRMEDTGRLTALPAPAAGPVTVAVTRSGTVQPRAGGGLTQTARTAGAVDASARFGQQPRPRVHRRIEHIRPTTYADAEQVAQELKRGSVVVLDLRTTRPDLAKRILDFSFGAASALEGQVDRHIDRVYVFTRNAALADEERAAIRV
jgi:cell division inhibitor SepF